MIREIKDFNPQMGLEALFVNIPLISDSNTFQILIYSVIIISIQRKMFSNHLYFLSASSISGENVKLSERIYIPSSKLRGFEYGKIGPKDGDDYIGGNYAVALNFSSSIPQLFENNQSTDFSVFMDIANLWGVDYNSGLKLTK